MCRWEREREEACAVLISGRRRVRLGERRLGRCGMWDISWVGSGDGLKGDWVVRELQTRVAASERVRGFVM